MDSTRGSNLIDSSFNIILYICNSIMSLSLWLAGAWNILQWLRLTNREHTWHLLCTMSSCNVQKPAKGHELLAVSCDLRSSRLLSPTSAAKVPRATSEQHKCQSMMLLKPSSHLQKIISMRYSEKLWFTERSSATLVRPESFCMV